jgi:hypothetical protein
MNKRTIYSVVAALAIAASATMYIVGKDSSHLSELRDFWWYPLPIALLCLVGAAAGKK